MILKEKISLFRNFIDNKIENFLILLVPIFCVFSRFLLELSLICISISFLYKVLKKQEFDYFKNVFSIVFLFFYFYLIISFLFSEYKQNIFTIIFYLRFLLYTLAIYYFLTKSENLFKNFLKVAVFIVGLLIIDSIIQFIFDYNIIGIKKKEIYRVSSFFGDEFILGSFLLKFLPFVVLGVIFLKNKSSILLLLSVYPLSIFFSGDRTAIFLMILLSILLFLVFFKFKKIRNLFFIFLMIIVTILVFSKDIQNRVVKRSINEMFKYDFGPNRTILLGKYKDNKIYWFSGLHHNLAATSIKIFKNYPFLGSGPKSYRYICKNKKELAINIHSCQNHPHNYYFQLLAETGTLGFVILMSFFIFFSFRIKKYLFFNDFKNKKKLIPLIFYIYYFVQLWPIIPHGNFFNNWISILLFLPFSFNLFLIRNKKKIN